MEGDEALLRKKAREARREGHAPSEEAATSGASKQRHHLPGGTGHDEKVDTVRKGKQKVIGERTPKGRPRDTL